MNQDLPDNLLSMKSLTVCTGTTKFPPPIAAALCSNSLLKMYKHLNHKKFYDFMNYECVRIDFIRAKNTWNSTPARGPWKPRSLKSFGETVTASAALAHLDALRENDMPFIQSSDGFMLVTTTCKEKFPKFLTHSNRKYLSKLKHYITLSTVESDLFCHRNSNVSLIMNYTEWQQEI